MNWTPIPHTIVKDQGLRETLHTQGYAVNGNIGEENLRNLKALYTELHQFSSNEGGMFYSLYSDDIDYRRKVYDKIRGILSPLYDSKFSNYKSVINSFIVKLKGPNSDFTLHQDSTGLNEEKYSPLSLWIPLQDTKLENGTLCVIPKTHKFFHPLRGVSFASPFKSYEATLKKYLVPIELNAGDILMFDNRLVHYSHLNLSESERIIVMSGLFPKEADILSVYKNESIPNAPYEIFKQSEDFLITNEAFYNNCTERPYRGVVIKEIHEELEAKTVYDFLSWAKKEAIEATNIPALTESKLTMHIVSEPN